MAIPSGYTPLDFVGFTDRGTYAGNVPYVRNDLVHHGGNIWLVLIDGTLGIVPSESANYTLWLGEPTNLVERIIAPLEDNPATVAYGVGRQIIFNDWLYEVIAPIAVGDALVTYESDPSNANIKLAPPVETQVLAIKAEADATDEMIAPNENGSTMSQSYVIGAQFIRGNVLYKAKAAITSGTAWSSLTLNTDYEVQSDSLVEQINTKQPKTLATPITVNNVQQTTVEGALGAINTDLGSTKQALSTTQGSIAPIEDGTNYSQSYNANQLFYHNGSLCYVTASSVNSSTAISIGNSGNAKYCTLEWYLSHMELGIRLTRTWQASELSNVSSGSIQVINRDGICCVKCVNLVCTADVVLLDISSYVGYVYEYDTNNSGLYIDNGRLYSKNADVGMRILTFVR